METDYIKKMELNNKNILIVGLGVSGVAAASFLKKRGAVVTVTDMADEEERGAYAKDIRKMGIPMEMGQHRMETFENADLIVISPGVPHLISPLQHAREKGVKIVGEIELASRFIKEPIAAVTGTNGKTTTTTLLGEMLNRSGLNVFIGGNIGNPLISYVDKNEKADVVVAEVSSFQLDTISTFKPKVGVLLNISEDHLDRYHDFHAYARSKGRIFINQDEDDAAVLNAADTNIKAVSEHIKSRKLYFNSTIETENIATINNKKIVYDLTGSSEISVFYDDISLSGTHNYENVSAAGLAALYVGANPTGIKSALKNFKGLAHRLEFVDAITGVKYFDDSKATNVDAVARALETFTGQVILIMGGRDKGGDYNVLEDFIRHRTKQLIVIGEAADNIYSSIGNIVPTARATSMADAVVRAHEYAEPGDSVLLSPACSSFDMFESYAQRGNVFCNEVKKLKDQFSHKGSKTQRMD